MSKARLIVTAVVSEKRTKSEVARDYDVSRYWVQQLVQRYLAEGETAFEPRSRRPHSSPRAIPAAVEDEIVLAPQGAVSTGTGCRRGHHPHAPGPSHPEVRAGPAAATRGLDDLADPDSARVRDPAAAEATPLVLAPVRSRTIQRTLAGRHHPLAAGRRHRGGDPQHPR
jgi:transposase-like protein